MAAFDLSLPTVNYQTGERRLAFSNELLTRIRALLGVEQGGAGLAIPFSNGGFGEYLSRPDKPGTAGTLLGGVDLISEGYLEALGARLVAGRHLTADDNRAKARRVV